ncbi:unnamed protein product, partial [marine sediment metagenome]
TVESDGVGHADLKEWLGVAPLALSSQQVQTDMTAIHGTALTETATQLAGAFVKFFNVSSPTGTVNSLADAVPGAAGGGFIAGTNAETTITTALNAAITGNITGDLSGTVGTTTTVSNGVALANGAITNASLAGNIEIVFETDFGTNYNTTRNAWATNHTDYIGTIPAAALGADCITAAKIADNAFVAANFAASSLDGKGDWNTTVPDAAGVAPTAAENADAVWDEVLTGASHNSPTTAGRR